VYKKCSRRLIKLRLTHCSHLHYFNNVFNNFLRLPFFNPSRSLWTSMEEWSALRFHQKYLNLCSEDERSSYGVGTTWGWVNTDRIFIFGWTVPLTVCLKPFALRWIPLMYSSFRLLWICKCECMNLGRGQGSVCHRKDAP